MKVVAISDTHGFHHHLQLPAGDLLLHAGDVSARGHKKQIRQFLRWFAAQDFRYKVFIAGNHDFYLEQASTTEIQDLIPDGITYLNDSGVTIEGVEIWGSPVQPRFFDWAFNRDRGADIDRHWALIPKTTNILLTHGPPFGVLDLTQSGINAGCTGLLQQIDQIQPAYCVFGHIHEGYGMQIRKQTCFINASSLNIRYEPVNSPVSFTID